MCKLLLIIASIAKNGDARSGRREGPKSSTNDMPKNATFREKRISCRYRSCRRCPKLFVLSIIIFLQLELLLTNWGSCCKFLENAIQASNRFAVLCRFDLPNEWESCHLSRIRSKTLDRLLSYLGLGRRRNCSLHCKYLWHSDPARDQHPFRSRGQETGVPIHAQSWCRSPSLSR